VTDHRQFRSRSIRPFGEDERRARPRVGRQPRLPGGCVKDIERRGFLIRRCSARRHRQPDARHAGRLQYLDVGRYFERPPGGTRRGRIQRRSTNHRKPSGDGCRTTKKLASIHRTSLSAGSRRPGPGKGYGRAAIARARGYEVNERSAAPGPGAVQAPRHPCLQKIRRSIELRTLVCHKPRTNQ